VLRSARFHFQGNKSSSSIFRAIRSRSCLRRTFRRRSVPSLSIQVIPSITINVSAVYRIERLRSWARRSLLMRLSTPFHADIFRLSSGLILRISGPAVVKERLRSSFQYSVRIRALIEPSCAACRRGRDREKIVSPLYVEDVIRLPSFAGRTTPQS
jgi:hypothetical protein